MTLFDLLNLMRKRLWMVIALPLVCALATAAYSWLMLPNTYTSSVTIYVLARNSVDQSNLSSELSASQMITNDVASLVKSARVTSQTAQELGLPDLDNYSISVNSATNTRVITISTTGASPMHVAEVANELAAVTNDIAQEVMDVESVNVLDKAAPPADPSGPPRTLYTLVAAIAGFFLAVAAIVLRDSMNTKVRTPDDVEELLGVPVVGRVPSMKH